MRVFHHGGRKMANMLGIKFPFSCFTSPFFDSSSFSSFIFFFAVQGSNKGLFHANQVLCHLATVPATSLPSHMQTGSIHKLYLWSSDRKSRFSFKTRHPRSSSVSLCIPNNIGKALGHVKNYRSAQ